MPTKQSLEFVQGSYQASSVPVSCQRTVNWIPKVPQVSSLTDGYLDDPSGLIEYCNISTGRPNRGATVMSGIAYFVNGTKLYSVSGGGNAIELGTISGTSRVSMANNGTKLVVCVPGSTSYVYDKTLGTVVAITDPDFISSSSVVFIDGYFVFSSADGTVVFNSAINDPLSYDALDTGTAEINPDKIVSVHVSHNELYVLGTDTIEIFQDVGSVDGFPFQRIPGASIQKGCYARNSTVDFDNSFLFIGGGLNEKLGIWKVTSSSSAEKISTDAIDLEIQKFTLSDIANAFAFTWSEGGSFFAAFTITSTTIPSRTFVYDATSSAYGKTLMWHERQTGVTDNSWRVSSIVFAYGKLLCGDIVDGRVGYLDSTTYQDYGDTRFRMRTCRPFFSNELPLCAGQMEVTMESGVGATSGQGSDPQIRLSYSDDGGRLWSNETNRSYGQIGEYYSLSIWRRTGQFPRHRVLMFISTEPVKTVMIKLLAYVGVGSQ